MFRRSGDKPEIFLVHPGGPFWAHKDEGAWSIPKGEPAEGEDLLLAARREFFEETGFKPDAPFYELGRIKQASGKIVTAWAFEGDGDPLELKSNLCEIEWAPAQLDSSSSQRLTAALGSHFRKRNATF
jgi:predicted NUDIX family NTP pyrophosphohydrolase